MNSLNFFLSFYCCFDSDSEGAAAVCVRQNQNTDQRQPRKIAVESYRNQQIKFSAKDQQGILPFASREATPQTECTDYIEEKGFFSGNPFVEVTKGIIHIYKKK